MIADITKLIVKPSVKMDRSKVVPGMVSSPWSLL